MRLLLTLSMIVKNESGSIERTLASVKPFIDRWVIVDTGSTDGTQAIVTRALEGVPGRLVELPFVNFAVTRNAALDLCGTDTEFILWLDADDQLDGGAALRAFLENERGASEPDREAYFIRVLMGLEFDSPRVVRSDAGWRFVGAVHEVLAHPHRAPPTRRIPNVAIAHDPADISVARSVRRWERDVPLLEESLARDPNNTRAAFYLARTHWFLEHWDAAEQAFHRRIAMGGWAEEVYESKFALGKIAAGQGRPWPETLALYLDAHAFDSRRAEPLFEIALHYHATAEHALCLLFARRGWELPFPADARLFVATDAYRWQLADLVASSAYWVGEFAMGEAAARQALENGPKIERERLERNVAVYLERRAPQP